LLSDVVNTVTDNAVFELEKLVAQSNDLALRDALENVVNGLVEYYRRKPDLYLVIRSAVPRIRDHDRRATTSATIQNILVELLQRQRPDDSNQCQIRSDLDLTQAAYIVQLAVDSMMHAAFEQHPAWVYGESPESQRFVASLIDLIAQYLFE